MQPMGREKIRFPSKTDGHFKKDGLRNWWEDEHQPNKKRERQRVKREIRDNLNDSPNVTCDLWLHGKGKHEEN